VHIVVGGCGYVGSAIAERLSADPAMDIVVVDSDRHAFDRLGTSFNGETIVGSVTDRGVLEQAGIDRADGFIAVTRSDNTNLMAVEIASKLYGVPRTVARLFNPDNAEAYRALGIDHVASTGLFAKLFLNELLEDRFPLHISFPDGQQDALEVCDLEVAEVGDACSVDELEARGRLRITAVTRTGRTWVPTGADRLLPGDVVTAAVGPGAAVDLAGLVRRPHSADDGDGGGRASAGAGGRR
jgi:trk system potassium uptake protein TrkA